MSLKLSLATLLLACTAFAGGPLRVLKSNPRYFTDDSGKAVYLAGSHTWSNFQDHGFWPHLGDPQPVFDYPGYLDELRRHDHNFFRLWRWETPQWKQDSAVGYCEPHPWLRTGPDNARDGKPRFDLTRFDQAYFDRLRARVSDAGKRGIYVSVMLFEGFASQFFDGFPYHPYNLANNVNGVDGDALGYYTLQKTEMGNKVLAFQEAYLRRVIDSVNDLDNVLYEVCNESGTFSHEWQYHVIRFVKAYEASKPRQHPVGMTVPYPNGLNAKLFDSPADWVSPNVGGADENYRDDPPATYRGKVVVSDTDHLWGHTGGDSIWVWKSFCRGLNVLFMEEMLPSPTWQDSARAGMGQTRRYSQKADLAAMTPQSELAETRYCLANPGKEYLVLQPGNKGEFWLSLTGAPGEFTVEWLNVGTGAVVQGKPVQGGERRSFVTPFGGPAVLYLKRTER